MSARILGLVLAAECVYVLVAWTHAVAAKMLARALAYFDRHVVVFAASSSQRWQMNALLGLGPCDACVGDAALGLNLVAALLRKAYVPYLCPTVHLHVIAEEGDDLLEDACRLVPAVRGVRVHTYGAARHEDTLSEETSDVSAVRVLTGADGRAVDVFPCGRVDLLVVCAGANLTDRVLNMVVGARPIDTMVLESDATVHMPLGWQEYLLQAAGRAYVCDGAECARFPPQYLEQPAARPTSRCAACGARLTGVCGQEDDEGQGGIESDDKGVACQSLAALVFSAVLWHRYLRPWWQVALQRDGSPMDVLGGCFCTAASSRFQGVRHAEPCRPVGECVLSLARTNWVP
jgi:hypothetical protein